MAIIDNDIIMVRSDEYPMIYENIKDGTKIEITKERYFDSDCFIARIVTSNPHLLQSCFANDNIRSVAPMTEVYRDHGAIFMVNADWCTSDLFCNFVIRNKEIHRFAVPSGASGAYFCVMEDGHLQFIDLRSTAQDALDAGVVHSFSFYGKNLFNKDGDPIGNKGDRAPRTFMGEVPRDDEFLEYIIVVADGRTHQSRGLNHWEESSILYEKGCNIGYNLDGGGSSEMVFDGKILNNPSDGHERNDHDFIYVKYGD